MEPKPAHLGLYYAEQFKDQAIADVYQQRPPYAAEAIACLLGLLDPAGPRTILDVGAGTGDLARRLASQVERLDAVDFSAAMLAKGRNLPGGADPHLHWIEGSVEDAPLTPPYALITAGESLHWLDWERVFPRFQRLLTPQGVLAIVGRGPEPTPWDAEVLKLIQRFSTNRDFRPYNLLSELERRQLFTKLGEFQTQPTLFKQSASAFLDSLHSRNGLSRDRLNPADSLAFDEGVLQVLSPFLDDDGLLSLTMTCSVVWGRPTG